MMHSLRKRHSWPPLRVTKSSKASPSIDQDPFAYFVSPVLDDERATQIHPTAGIATRRRSRSLPSFHPKPRYSQSATDRAKRRVAKLKKWIERMQIAYLHHNSPDPVTIPAPPPPTSPKTLDELLPMKRGRDIKATATSRVRVKTRTPPRKPHAWREPSENLWPVTEEAEEIGLGIRCEGMDQLLQSKQT